ncbi:MAG: hypothetical protein GWM98_24205, partial [Nitrospinaceae bacterium]|nr:hypothetical protein [Nitrospinaceae bacterium]NIS87453.1 hypothetical protein [Nitrospinaceae bacterium]NIT84302.1 hypothetical protein [Nitrospinaceae bacterium]NIU98686.1 hypothetical protein [Nitrospinaceae bacterium]NIW61235.1 hypothetical protein [Nitrospinaceae bacterium]
MEKTQVDTGCVQDNFIQIDIHQSFQNLADFYQNRSSRLKHEKQWLQDNAIDLVLTD